MQGCVFDLDRAWPDAGPADADQALGNDLPDRGARDAGHDLRDTTPAESTIPAPDVISHPDQQPSPDLRPASCGDGKINGTDQCDASDLGSKTCKGLGHTGGALSCKWDCTLETSGCYKVLDPAGIVISKGGGSHGAPAVATTGTGFLATWHLDGTTIKDIKGARVSASGGVLDKTGISISSASGKQAQATIGSDGSSYLAVWADQRGSSTDIYGTRVSAAGAVLDPKGFAISTATGGQYKPRIAFDGTNYLVVWIDSRSGEYDIYAARVSKAGAVLDPSGIAVSTAKGMQRTPSVSFGGSNYLVVWEDRRNVSQDIYGARISTAGSVLDNKGFAICTAQGDQYPPTVAHDGKNFMVVWSDRRDGKNFRVYGARVSAGGAVLDKPAIPISKAPGNQTSPSIAFGGGSYFVVWSGSLKIAGARVASTGDVQDKNGIVVFKGPAYADFPEVSFAAGRFFAVWTNWPDITVGARVVP